MPEDITINCRSCQTDFIWSSGEQDFYTARGLTNSPARCPSCRATRRADQEGGGGGGGGSYGDRGPRQMFDVTCASCGGNARVPFQPRGDKPVYCSDCFRSQR
jgi:CxxC-x17-CxxC domain-containing protein